jgi:hypothetical protein
MAWMEFALTMYVVKQSPRIMTTVIEIRRKRGFLFMTPPLLVCASIKELFVFILLIYERKEENG